VLRKGARGAGGHHSTNEFYRSLFTPPFGEVNTIKLTQDHL